MNKNIIQTNEGQRTTEFSRNNNLESLLKDLNSSLWIAEKQEIERYTTPKLPIIFIMGPLRSGTTLFTQWLANTGLVAYPTNLLSRFYHAPVIGAKIQLLLTDPRFNFRNELGEFAQQAGYSSENGKTKGVLSPNEFWYFWRRFLADPKQDSFTDQELSETFDSRTMLAELAGITDVFGKPFAAKGMLFNYNIPFLDSILDKVVFIQIQRDPVTNVASILEARKRQLGSENEWYSFKIPEYEQLQGLDPITQSAGQLHYINKAVTKGISTVNSSRKLIVQYEDFCQNPHSFYEQLVNKLDMKDNIPDYQGPAQFKLSRDTDLPNKATIKEALAKFRV